MKPSFTFPTNTVATKPVATKPKAMKPKAMKPVATKPKAMKPVATKSETLSDEKIIELYINQLSESEKKGLEIAKDHLESSFSLEKSIGFLKFKKKLMGY